jgi:hypothetical protein
MGAWLRSRKAQHLPHPVNRDARINVRACDFLISSGVHLVPGK